MAITVSIDKLISTKVLKELENNLIAKRICTLDTGSQINKKGDQVTFTGIGDPTVQEYQGTINYEQLEDEGITLKINKADYVAFKVDDIEAFRSSIDIKGTQVERSGYKIKDKADKYVLSLATDASITNRIDAHSAGKEVSEDNALQYVAKVRRMLDEANVPHGQAFFVIDPMFKEKLELAGIKFGINEGMKGFEGGLEWADYLGMKIFVSNNVKVDSESKTHYLMAGSYNAIVYADQIIKSRFIAEAENAFEGLYSSLHVYDAKPIKPAELVVLEAKEAV
nr:MAG TPA: Major capsid protein [Caudoviricetes sp.]